MSEMVERVARAIAHAAAKDVIDTFVQVPGQDPVVHVNAKNAEAVARAAIAAMLEPTREMLSVTSREEFIEDAWKAMIREALQ